MENNESIGKTAHELKQATKDAFSSAKEETKDITQQAKKVASETISQASDDFAEVADQARESLKNLSPAMEEMSAKAQELASRGIEFCASCTEHARQQFQKTADATTRYVAEQPAKSVVIAALAGAAVAAAFISRSRRP